MAARKESEKPLTGGEAKPRQQSLLQALDKARKYSRDHPRATTDGVSGSGRPALFIRGRHWIP